MSWEREELRPGRNVVEVEKKTGCGEAKLSFRPNPVCFSGQLTQHRQGLAFGRH